MLEQTAITHQYTRMSEAQDTDFWKNRREEVQSRANSNPSASELSDDPSSDSLHTSSSSSSKKRKAQSETAARARLKRLKPFFKTDYRDLFDNTVNEIVNGPAVNQADLLPMSQIGVTQWSSYEKENFFTTLAKKGRYDLSSIAAAIGTKSELEVHVYHQLLQKATAEQHLHGPCNQLFETYEIPGAFEVSQECSATLELNADALAFLNQREEEKVERRNYDKLWLLNGSTVRLLSQRERLAKSDKRKVLDALVPAELLNLKNFLELSKQVFMNSSLAEENWRSYTEGRTEPSILCAAFSDFHKLAISVTKRLIQSSLFFAMSRIRAGTSSYRLPKKRVRLEDVSAALNVLGMKHNSQSFWIEVARRCKIAVYDDVKGPNSIDKGLTYDDVEKRLGRRSRIDEENVEYSPKLNMIAATSELTSLSLEIDQHQSLSESVSNTSFDSAGLSEDGWSPRLSRQDEGYSYHLETADDDLDLYAEAVDMCSSQREELLLWKMLGQDPPANIKATEIKLPKRPRPVRKTIDDLDDWRSWVDYAPEWEVHGNPTRSGSSASTRRRGRTRSRTRLNDRMSIRSDSSESKGFEDDNEVSSPIRRTNLAHDRWNDDDEEGASTSDSERENSTDEIPSESEGPDDTIAQAVDSDEEVSVEAIGMG